MRSGVVLLILLAGCTTSDALSEPPQTTLRSVSAGTVGAVATRETVNLSPMPSVPPPTVSVDPALSRDAEVALRRCLQAIGDDFLPLTMRDSFDRADAAVALCNEATIQLQVEPPSEFVTFLLDQVGGAAEAIVLVELAGRPKPEDAEILKASLDGYVSRVSVRLDAAWTP